MRADRRAPRSRSSGPSARSGRISQRRRARLLRDERREARRARPPPRSAPPSRDRGARTRKRLFGLLVGIAEDAERFDGVAAHESGLAEVGAEEAVAERRRLAADHHRAEAHAVRAHLEEPDELGADVAVLPPRAVEELRDALVQVAVGRRAAGSPAPSGGARPAESHCGTTGCDSRGGLRVGRPGRGRAGAGRGSRPSARDSSRNAVPANANPPKKSGTAELEARG